MGKIMVLCICFGGISGLLAMIFWNNRHSPVDMRGSEGQKGRLACFYPTAYKIHIFWRHKVSSGYPEEKIRRLQKTRPGRSWEELGEWYDCQKIAGILAVTLFTMAMILLAVLAEDSKRLLQKSYLLIREEPGMGDREVRLHVSTEWEKREITLMIPERQYQREELEARFAEAKQYVQSQYLGANATPERVTKPLRLASYIPDSQIKIRWRIDGSGCINKDGSLNNKGLPEKTEVLLTAVFSYGEEQAKLPLTCIVYPSKRTRKEVFWEKWQQEMERRREQTAQEHSMPLPQMIDDENISYREICHSIWPRIVLMGVVLCLLFPILFDYLTEQEVMKREQELKKEYPEIVERFLLLVSAGLTIRGAWYRITDDYLKRRQKEGYASNCLYEEMLITRREMENGQNEASAYGAFGRRLSIPQYMKFSTLLIQNLKKGSDDLLKRMDMEAVDAVRERREAAKKRGEEAETKLLFPMMLMLAIVFAMILIAAFQNM